MYSVIKHVLPKYLRHDRNLLLFFFSLRHGTTRVLSIFAQKSAFWLHTILRHTFPNLGISGWMKIYSGVCLIFWNKVFIISSHVIGWRYQNVHRFLRIAYIRADCSDASRSPDDECNQRACLKRNPVKWSGPFSGEQTEVCDLVRFQGRKRLTYTPTCLPACRLVSICEL